MMVQNSDTVVSSGRLYRVAAKPDGTVYESLTQPTHSSGAKILDGINWSVVQTNVTYTAGVRNVTFRDIFLEKPRVAFSIHFDNDHYSRSYYPGAAIPLQEQLTFENVRVLHDARKDFLSIGTPVDAVTMADCSLRDNPISFRGNKAMPDYLKTRVNMIGCTFNYSGRMDVLMNSVSNKLVLFKTAGSTETSEKFSARVLPGEGTVTIDSDLTGLRK